LYGFLGDLGEPFSDGRSIGEEKISDIGMAEPRILSDKIPNAD
jgi:hypothetical protein